MADIVGVLSFAFHATHKVWATIEPIRSAPSDIQALRDDALQVHELLTKVLGVQERGGQQIPLHATDYRDVQVDALVKSTQRVTALADTFISKATVQRDDGTYQVRKLAWPLYAGEARKLSAQFRAFYASLSAFYAVSTLCVQSFMTHMPTDPNHR